MPLANSGDPWRTAQIGHASSVANAVSFSLNETILFPILITKLLFNVDRRLFPFFLDKRIHKFSAFVRLPNIRSSLFIILLCFRQNDIYHQYLILTVIFLAVAFVLLPFYTH